jgi:hypothetical protein
MKAFKGKKGAKSTGASDKISLNPQREEDDRRAAEQALADPATKEVLECVWYCTLHGGETLRTEKCDLARFRAFAQLSGYATNDKTNSTVTRAFDAQMEIDEKLLFNNFVRSIFHLGFEKFETQDYAVSLKKMLDTYLIPFVQTHRKLNEMDGSEPDDRMLTIAEVDRFLYVFDGVFERVFARYRDSDKHQTRELTVDQMKVLDQFMELDEIKDMLKDFGYFPKFVSFVEMSKAAQYACFGRIVVDPTKQGPGRTSNIEVKKDAGASVGVPIDLSATSAATSPVGAAANPLYIPSLPSEYQTEVLIDKPRLMSFLLRIAQVVYSRPENIKTCPSMVSRAEELMRQFGGIYEKIFGRTIESDCDFSEKGPPILVNTGALSPQVGSMKGGFELHILGSNFCEKRGVFVRFGAPEIVVRCKTITKKKVIVDAPAMKPKDVEFHVDFRHGEYDVTLHRVAKVFIECSNNRWEFSNTDPLQMLTFREVLPKHVIDEATSALLMKLFGAVCSINDRGNTKLMSREKWRFFKQMCSLAESLDGREDCEPFFLEVAEYFDGSHDISLNFKGFLRVLARTLMLMHGDEWPLKIHEVANIKFDERRKAPDPGPRVEQNEVVLARRAISMVERRSARELDIFLGPVLCGFVSSRPGDITSSCSGRTVTHVKAHPFLSYDQLELNTEMTVMRHIQMSQSMEHLLARLRQDGFDFAAHHPKSKTRKPAGRCWSLCSAQEKVIGAVWDYQGNYSCLQWQPAEKEMYSDAFTFAMYEEEQAVDFITCYLSFAKSKTVDQLRSSLEIKGYRLETKLFRVP